MTAGAGARVEVEGRALKLSNLDKVLYPEAGFVKAQVIDYYTRVARHGDLFAPVLEVTQRLPSLAGAAS